MKLFILSLFALVALTQAKTHWNDVRPRDIYSGVKGLPGYFTGNERVVGGEEAKPHQFPSQAALLIKTSQGDFFCGGSLITPNYVLTAAHCADGAQSIEVILGAHKFREEEPTQVRLTSKIFIVHEKWNSILLHDDIALIKLPSSVELNENIAVATLPTRSEASNQFTGEMATVSGWGKDKDSAVSVSPVLRFVATEVISHLKCLLTYPIVRSSHLCTSGSGGKSSCNGDSGGPLVCMENGVMVQVGLVSFGRADGCEKGHASVYTRITSYLDWIEKNSDYVIKA